MTEDTGRLAPKAPPARLWWILLARAAAALLLGLSVLLAEKSRPALGTIMLVDALAVPRMGRVFGQAEG